MGILRNLYNLTRPHEALGQIPAMLAYLTPPGQPSPPWHAGAGDQTYS